MRFNIGQVGGEACSAAAAEVGIGETYLEVCSCEY